MRFRLPTAEYAPPVSKHLLVARLILAAIFTILVLAQLFAFEKMGTVIEGLVPSLSHEGAKLLAAIMVLIELVAIPSLLVVAMSPLARRLSRMAAPLSMAAWYVLIFRGILTARVPNSGLLGSEIVVPATVWALVFVVLVFGASVTVQYLDARKLRT